MGDKINISFKDSELEKKLLKYLREQSQLIGISNYIKQLILEDMKRKGSLEK